MVNGGLLLLLLLLLPLPLAVEVDNGGDDLNDDRTDRACLGLDTSRLTNRPSSSGVVVAVDGVEEGEAIL